MGDDRDDGKKAGEGDLDRKIMGEGQAVIDTEGLGLIGRVSYDKTFRKRNEEKLGFFI